MTKNLKKFTAEKMFHTKNMYRTIVVSLTFLLKNHDFAVLFHGLATELCVALQFPKHNGVFLRCSENWVNLILYFECPKKVFSTFC
jgi:hypothetical protein